MRVTIVQSDARAREKPCLRCGYSLRKLTDSRHCPECGLSVWLSLNQNDTLEWSNPAWIRRMTLGALLMLLAQALGLAAYVLLAMHWFPQIVYQMDVERVVNAAIMDDDSKIQAALAAIAPPAPRYHLLRMSTALGGAYLIAYHIGLFLLASNERRYPDRLGAFRTAAWVVCALAGLVSLLLFTWTITPFRAGLFAFLVKLTAIASAVVSWAYLRRIARRVPQGALVRICGILTFVPLVSLLKVFPCFAAAMVYHLAWVLDFLPLAYLPFSIFLLGWFVKIFRRAGVSAEQSWAAETGPATPAT